MTCMKCGRKIEIEAGVLCDPCDRQVVKSLRGIVSGQYMAEAEGRLRRKKGDGR